MGIAIAAVNRFTAPTGICRFAANLASDLAAHPAVEKVVVAAGEWQVDYMRSLARDAVKIEYTPVAIRNSSAQRNAWYWLHLREWAREAEAELVHLSYPVPCRTPWLPTVATVHDLYPWDMPSNFGYPNVYFNRAIFQHCIRRVSAITCVSQSTYERLHAHAANAIASKPVAVIHNTVHLASPAAPASAADLSAGFLLCVGQHRKNKRHDLVIAAFDELRRSARLAEELKLVIVGSEDSETASLRRLVEEKGLASRVLFVSGIDDAQLAWYYANCRVFVCASELEGYCLPVAEALSAGCRVVCSDLPVLREVGRDCCTYFQPHTAQALVEALDLELRTQRLARRPSHLQPESTAEAYLQLYRRVMSASRRHPMRKTAELGRESGS